MTIRSRKIQRADLAAIRVLLERGQTFEPMRADPERVFEIDTRLVAVSAAHVESIAPPVYQPEPVPPIDEPFVVGPHRAMVGDGLVVVSGLASTDITMIHRLARSLYAQELGARFVLVRAPLLELPPFEPGGVVQQIACGAVVHDPVGIPLAEGYWPIGTIGDRVVMVRQNDAF